MTFAELCIGDRFEFDHGSDSVIDRSLAHGPWEKLSARRYQPFGNNQYDSPHRVCRVGTVKVQVKLA